jgi:hypothetical protein
MIKIKISTNFVEFTFHFSAVFGVFFLRVLRPIRLPKIFAGAIIVKYKNGEVWNGTVIRFGR